MSKHTPASLENLKRPVLKIWWACWKVYGDPQKCCRIIRCPPRTLNHKCQFFFDFLISLEFSTDCLVSSGLNILPATTLLVSTPRNILFFIAGGGISIFFSSNFKIWLREPRKLQNNYLGLEFIIYTYIILVLFYLMEKKVSIYIYNVLKSHYTTKVSVNKIILLLHQKTNILDIVVNKIFKCMTLISTTQILLCVI